MILRAALLLFVGIVSVLAAEVDDLKYRWEWDLPASSKRRKMHPVGARVKEIAFMRKHAVPPGKGSVTAEIQTFLPVFRVMAR